MMMLKNVVFLCSALLYSCSEDVDSSQFDLNNHSVKTNRNGLYRCPPEELCKKYPLKKYSWKEKKTIAKSFVIGTTTQQEVIEILGIDIVRRSNPPVIDSLGYCCNKSDPEYPGDEWLKFLDFHFNEEGKLVNYYEVKVPYPVPH
ncbi:hypothetical protein [uncultured Akkermansia sp.]|uniref:hypothetical protein n=1 Tax=uncultured Akkermansia sp. TaxID=512294 RepID=UPI002628E37F|nr:hypothetical protein [uncultured Akkermansia sp.]